MITAIAPSRICDVGGWTDTWFARHGRVLNIAVLPGVEVRLTIRRDAGGNHITFIPASTPLLDAAVQSAAIPADIALEIAVSSEMPPGAATGTSASVTVALLGALWFLKSGSNRIGAVELTDSTRYAIARAAHRVETDLLRQQSGVQDQLASAFGGISVIDVHEYPEARVTPLAIDGGLAAELERRLLLVFLGESHRSSEVHDRVIRALSEMGPDCRQLDDLRHAADAAHDALRVGDLEAFGRALVANSDAQARLHPDIVSDEAQAVIAIARRCGAAGWKVNGAGGRGGSVSILAGARARRQRLLQALASDAAPWRVIPTRICTSGLRIHAE